MGKSILLLPFFIAIICCEFNESYYETTNPFDLNNNPNSSANFLSANLIKSTEGNLKLEWIDQKSSLISGFELLRKKNGSKNFEQVKGFKGLKSLKGKYSFTIPESEPGDGTLYRLIIVGKNSEKRYIDIFANGGASESSSNSANDKDGKKSTVTTPDEFSIENKDEDPVETNDGTENGSPTATPVIEKEEPCTKELKSCKDLSDLYVKYNEHDKIKEKLAGKGFITHRYDRWYKFLTKTGLETKVEFREKFEKKYINKGYSEVDEEIFNISPFFGQGKAYREEKYNKDEKQIYDFRKGGEPFINPWLFLSDAIFGCYHWASPNKYGLCLDQTEKLAQIFYTSEDIPVIRVRYQYVPMAMVFTDVNANLIGNRIKLVPNDTIKEYPLVKSGEVPDTDFLYLYHNKYSYLYFWTLTEKGIGETSRLYGNLADNPIEINNFWHDNHNISTLTPFWIMPSSRKVDNKDCLKPEIYCSKKNDKTWDGKTHVHYNLPIINFEVYDNEKLILKYEIRYKGYLDFSKF